MTKFDIERLIRIELKKISENFDIDKWLNLPLPGFNHQTPRALIDSDRGQDILDNLQNLSKKRIK